MLTGDLLRRLLNSVAYKQFAARKRKDKLVKVSASYGALVLLACLALLGCSSWYWHVQSLHSPAAGTGTDSTSREPIVGHLRTSLPTPSVEADGANGTPLGSPNLSHSPVGNVKVERIHCPACMTVPLSSSAPGHSILEQQGVCNATISALDMRPNRRLAATGKELNLYTLPVTAPPCHNATQMRTMGDLGSACLNVDLQDARAALASISSAARGNGSYGSLRLDNAPKIQLLLPCVLGALFIAGAVAALACVQWCKLAKVASGLDAEIGRLQAKQRKQGAAQQQAQCWLRNEREGLERSLAASNASLAVATARARAAQHKVMLRRHSSPFPFLCKLCLPRKAACSVQLAWFGLIPHGQIWYGNV